MIATYGGYEVDVRTKACHLKIYVKEGVRGFGYPATAYKDDNGEWHVSSGGEKLTVERVVTLVDVVNGIYEGI